MPRIFDNIDLKLLPALQETLCISDRADFAVGYFHLRGWKCLDRHIKGWAGGDGHRCGLLIGMQKAPKHELGTAMSLADEDAGFIINDDIKYRMGRGGDGGEGAE